MKDALFEEEDQEFNNIAKIYYTVNLIQRSFRVLKSNWVQRKKQKNTNLMPFQKQN